MKISVIIIAHNEEKYIEECILSIINQTQKADEIILIAHNCNDKTIEIASRYNKEVTLINYEGPAGIVHARVKGLSNVSGDIILCIDGDSKAKSNWIKEMTQLLNSNNNILVASWVKLKGTLLGFFYNYFSKLLFRANGYKTLRKVWGPSFAFSRKDIEKVRSIFLESLNLSKKLGLTRNPDDYWLALYMSEFGGIEITQKTHVIQNQKEKNTIKDFYRHWENYKNGRKMELFFNGDKSCAPYAFMN